jgi:hypothetical protein
MLHLVRNREGIAKPSHSIPEDKSCQLSMWGSVAFGSRARTFGCGPASLT